MAVNVDVWVVLIFMVALAFFAGIWVGKMEKMERGSGKMPPLLAKGIVTSETQRFVVPEPLQFVATRKRKRNPKKAYVPHE